MGIRLTIFRWNAEALRKSGTGGANEGWAPALVDLDIDRY